MEQVGRRPLNPRKVFNGILWILKSGACWRDLPPQFDNRNSIYHKFRKWCESDLFRLLLQIINTDAHSNQAIGTSRGGRNTKVHVLINERMQLINVVLTGGQIKVLADKAYSCEKIRNQLEERGAHVCIPDKSNFKMKHFFDSELYKRRNIIERFFQRIKNYRHIAFLLLRQLFTFNLPTTPRACW